MDVSPVFWPFVRLIALEDQDDWQLPDSPYERMRDAALAGVSLTLSPGGAGVPPMRDADAGVLSADDGDIAWDEAEQAYVFVDTNALFYGAGRLLARADDRALLERCVAVINRSIVARGQADALAEGIAHLWV